MSNIEVEVYAKIKKAEVSIIHEYYKRLISSIEDLKEKVYLEYLEDFYEKFYKTNFLYDENEKLIVKQYMKAFEDIKIKHRMDYEFQFLFYQLISSYIVIFSNKIQFQLIEFVKDCLKKDISDKDDDAIKEIKKESLKFLGIDIKNEDGFDLTRTLSNVIKHGKGCSFNHLKNKYPKYLNGIEKYSKCSSFFTDLEVILNIDQTTVDLICSNICNMWDKISQAFNNPSIS